MCNGLKDENGVWCWDQVKLSQMALSFYKQLFSSVSSLGSSASFTHLFPPLNEEDRTLLAAPFSTDEVKFAFFSMDSYKALRPDGFPACFYQKAWDAIGKSVVDMVLGVLHGGLINSGICDIMLTLILKVSAPKSLSQFWPISLCNVACKAITKVLVHQMERVLPSVFSSNQCSFIFGRQLYNNVIIL